MANKQVYHIYFKSDIQWTSWFDWSRAARHDSVFVKDKTLNIVCSDIVTCIDVFITNWQRVLHISHLAQQLASTTWREQYGVEITRFDFRQLVLEMKKLHDPTSFVTMNIQWTSQVCEGVLRERRGEYRLVVDRHTTLPTLSLLEQHLSRHGNLRSVIELSNRTLSVFDTIQMACPTAQIYARDVNRIRVYHTDIKYGLDILLEPNGQLQLIDVKEWIELKSPITATTPTQPTLLPLPPTEWTKLLQIDWRPIEVLASTSAFSKFFTAIIEQQQQIDENNDIDGELVSLPGTIICHDPIHHGTRRSVGSILLVHLLQQWSSEVATTTSTTTTTTSATITTSTANTPTTANTTMSNTNNNNSTTMNATAVVVTEETTDGNDAIMTMMV
ncbi:hypothetical protein BDF22DRAFT_224120 [Syncephalis plumigaleata]|nr:hypothetical protein BDF22DRAFT_224120 [Syncephalis plumigaleata]